MTDFRTQVAEEMIRQIEAGAMPWQKPWRPGVIRSRPFNPASGKDYRGINAWWLDMQGHQDPRWLTYRQANTLDAQVRKGERGTTVQYWQWTREEPRLDDDGKPILGDDGKPETVQVRLEHPRVFTARVFNAAQIDGLAPLVVPAPTFEPVAEAEKILAAGGVPIHHDQGDRAFYRPMTDSIHLPAQAAFPAAYQYYATALHELGHATGHGSRLGRQFGPFGSRDYAVEELRAEMASFMLTTELGLGHYPERHAGYVESWLKALNDDHNLLFRAARDAEIIRSWVLEPERRQALEMGAVLAKAAAATPVAQPTLDQAPDTSLALSSLPGVRLSQNRDSKLLEAAMPNGQVVSFGGTPALAQWAMEAGLSADDLKRSVAMAASATVNDSEETVALARSTTGLGDGGTVDRVRSGTHEGPFVHVGARFAVQQIGPDTDNRLVVHDLAQMDGASIVGAVVSMEQKSPVAVSYEDGPNSRSRIATELAPVQKWLAEVKGPDQRIASTPDLHRSDKLLAAIGGFLRNEVDLVTRPDGGRTALLLNDEVLSHVSGPVTQDTALRSLGEALSGALKEEGRTLNGEVSQMSLDEFTVAYRMRGIIPEFEITAQEIGTLVKSNADGLLEVDVRELHASIQKELAPSLAAPENTARHYLDVPYAERNQAKALGAKWDKEAKSWYAPEGVDPAALAKWEKGAEKAAPAAHRASAPEVAASSGPPAQAAKQDRLYLAVPYAERDAAKAAGARWDRHRKSWYVAADADRAAVTRWQAKEPAVSINTTVSPVREFADALTAHGLAIDGEPVMDGRWHRVAVEGDRKGVMSGSYRGFLDGVPNGQLMNYRTGKDAVKWVATGTTIDPAERANLQAQAATRAAQREVERTEQAERGAQVARGLLRGAERIDTEAQHPYLERKTAFPFSDVRVKDDTLIIPMHTAAGVVRNVQSISPEGEKRYVAGAEKTGLHHMIDPDRMAGLGALIVAEGYATGSTLHDAVSLPVAVAFDAGNLKPVAEALRAKYPDAAIIIAADNDHHLEAKNKPNTGIERATAAAQAVNGRVIVPDFTEAERTRGLTDFNDLLASRGPEATRATITDALQAVLQQAEQQREHKPQQKRLQRQKAPDRAAGMTM